MDASSWQLAGLVAGLLAIGAAVHDPIQRARLSVAAWAVWAVWVLTVPEPAGA